MLGEVSALGAAFTWAVSSLILKSLTYQLRPLLINALRTFFASLFGLAILFALGDPGQIAQFPLRPLGFLVASGIVGVFGAESLYVMTLARVDVAKVYPISIGGFALLTFLLAALFLGERLDLSMLLGSALVIISIFLLLSPKGISLPKVGPGERWGLALLLVACGGWAVAVILVRLAVTEVGVIVGNAVRLPLATALLLGISLPRGLGGISRRNWLLVALAGLMSYGLGSLLFLEAIKLAGAARATILSSTSPLFLVPLSFFFLKEKITVVTLLGTILCVLGVALIV